MAGRNTTTKILRVGVIQNGTIIEERLFRKRETVTIGTSFRNTFCVSAPQIPASFHLFDVKGGNYLLNFDDSMVGRISVSGSVHTLDSLRKNKKIPQKGKFWTISLDEKSRGKVEVGDVILLFQFITPPPTRPTPQLPKALRGNPVSFLSDTVELHGTFGRSLIASTVLQVGFALFLLTVPPPPRPTGAGELIEDLRMMMASLEEEEELETDPNAEDLEVSDEGEVIEEEPEEEPEEERQREEPEEQQQASNREARLEVARQEVRQQSVLGAMFTNDDGTGGALDQVFNISDRRVSHVMERAQARGESALAGRGLGSADPSSETGQVVDVNVGGSQIAEQAENVDTGGERERVEVRAEVRGGRSRTSGSGNLDPDYLNRVLRQKVRDVQRCYERFLPENPNLRGRVLLQFTIGTDGRVSEARIVQNETNDQVGDCIESRVRRWRFDPPEGGSLSVQKTFILEPAS